jgi:DNA-binding beta-propeller fold protein YncE
MQRLVQRLGALIRGLALALAALLVSLPAGSPLSAGSAQPLAPENLRCPGRTLPEPQNWYRWAWQWEVLDTYQFGGRPAGESPYAVALDRACNLYVADGQDTRIVKLSPEGAILARIPIPLDEPADTSPPQGVAVDPQGNIYVSYYARNRVLQFSPQGQLLATWGRCSTPTAENRFCDPRQPGLFVGPRGLTVDGAGNVYVMEIDRIQKLTTAGRSVAVWDLAGRIPGELWILGQPALDLAGNLYVPDTYNNRVLKLSPEGALVAQFGGGPDPSPEPGRFHNPTAVAVDQAGNLFVAEQYNWRVQKLGPDGSFMDQWRNCLDGPACTIPANGDAPGQFFNASGLVVDGQGNVYVADSGNMRVQRLMAYPVLIPESERRPAP